MTESEHDPVESARPSIGRRDRPDALRLGADDRADRKLPADGDVDEDAPDTPRPDAPSGPGAQR
jgi:hypothetical protein